MFIVSKLTIFARTSKKKTLLSDWKNIEKYKEKIVENGLY